MEYLRDSFHFAAYSIAGASALKSHSILSSLVEDVYFLSGFRNGLCMEHNLVI